APDRIQVRSDGTVVPRKAAFNNKTSDTDAHVVVSYPGAEAVRVPVRAVSGNPVKRLAVKGLKEGEAKLLPRLNTYFPLPNLVAVLEDGTRAELSGQFPLAVEGLKAARGLVETRKDGAEIRATKAIPEDRPLELTYHLEGRPETGVALPIAAKNAPPEVSLNVPGKVAPGGKLQLEAEAEDDAEVARVVFRMDGKTLGARSQPPYRLSVPVTEGMAGQPLTVGAVAVDEAGQRRSSAPRKVTVDKGHSGKAPEAEMVQPGSMDRFVEGGSVPYAVKRDLGCVKKGQGGSMNAEPPIREIEFFRDDTPVGSSHFGRMELREDPGCEETGKRAVRVWEVEGQAPQIATEETSASVFARLHWGKDRTKDLQPRLIRILANSPPNATIVSPEKGKSVTAGSEIPVKVRISDDTLKAGFHVTLRANGEELLAKGPGSGEGKANGKVRLDQGSTHRTLSLEVPAKRKGQSLNLVALVE
ncbi:MAG: Ig-like domain-containing protein, partial [Thiohalorhabdaceae bacterium]